MRWLLVVGVSLDLSGALLMASAVLGRSAGENREEATTRYDHNFWVVLIREREQSRVRVGALLLGLGFVLQAIGFLLGFGGLQIAVASLAAIATIAVAYAIGLCLAEARVPLKYHESLLLPAGIQDERHVYRLADEKEVHEWRRLHSLRILGHGLEITGQAVEPRIDHGRWLFDCPVCQGAATVATPTIKTCVCLTCGRVFDAVFPSNRTAIERLLLPRPEPNRNWRPGETIEQLKAENDADGIVSQAAASDPLEYR